MSRLQEINGRIANIGQIESIVSMLRVLAVTHQAEARTHLEAIRRHEAMVAAALCSVLTGNGVPSAPPAPGTDLVIVIGAAQGFCGAYADRMADAARDEVQRGATLMIVGARTVSAIESAKAPVWSADMVPHAKEVPALASRLADQIFSISAQQPDLSVRLLFGDPEKPGQVPVSRRLFPFDFSRFTPSSAPPPLTFLPTASLVAALVEEYVFAEMCEALMLGFAAENAARAEAMARAQSNVKRIGADLKVEFQTARQEQMTTEIIEVSAGL